MTPFVSLGGQLDVFFFRFIFVIMSAPDDSNFKFLQVAMPSRGSCAATLHAHYLYHVVQGKQMLTSVARRSSTILSFCTI